MELDRLITQVAQKTRAIDLIVSKLEELRFPSDNPKRLAHLIGNIAKAIEGEILARYRANHLSVEDFENEVKLAVRALEELGSHFRFAERATTQQTPWSLVHPLEKISEQLHPNSCFVIRPQWHYNYSILELVSAYREAFSKLLAKDRLEEALKLNRNGSVEKLYVVGFPYLERLGVLLHALLGHELGHPIEKEYFGQEQPIEFIPKLIDALLKERKVSSLQALDLFERAEFARTLRRVLELRRRVLEELICDLVSVNLFGPAALLATEEFALSRGLDVIEIEPPEHHYPPWRYRLRTMWEEFTEDWWQQFKDKGSFNRDLANILDNKLNFIRSIVEQDSDKQLINSCPETLIAYESVEEALPKIRQFVKKRLEQQGIRLDDLVGRVNTHLLQRLEDWIPPDAYVDDKGNEIVSDIRSILNVGWLRWICNYAKMPTAPNSPEEVEKYFEEVDALNRLVLKAIEYVDLRSWYQKQQEGSQDGSADE
jgi:hypothetical protein